MNDMNNEFIDLISCFTSEKLIGERKRYKDGLNQITNRIEEVINPNGNEKFKLTIDNICPIASSSDKFKYTIIGLNPHYSRKKGEPMNDFVQSLEFSTWEEIAYFHTNREPEINHIFERVTSSIGPYYRNLAILCRSLEEKRLVKWSEFRSKASKIKLQEKYIDMIKNNPMAVVELIPFGSEQFPTLNEKKLKILFEKVPEVKEYLYKLLSITKERVIDDGVIICNGKAVCEAFPLICSELGEGFELRKVLDNKDEGFGVFYLGSIKIVMLYNFLRARGKLNSYQQIENMIENVKDI